MVSWRDWRYPACISQARDLLASAGESGIALLSGPKACSILSLKGAFSRFACRDPKDRNRAPSTDVGMTTAAAKENTTAVTVRKTRIDNVSSISDLDGDNPSNHKIADGLQTYADHYQNVSQWFGKKGPNEAGTHHLHDYDDQRRQTHQKHHGQAPLCGKNTHLAHDLEALADHVGQVVENLSQIAAGFTLQHDRGHEEFHVYQRYALGKVHQRIPNRQTELLFLK